MAAKQFASHLKGGSNILPNKLSSFDNLVMRRIRRLQKRRRRQREKPNKKPDAGFFAGAADSVKLTGLDGVAKQPAGNVSRNCPRHWAGGTISIQVFQRYHNCDVTRSASPLQLILRFKKELTDVKVSA